MIFEPKKIKSVTVSIISPSIFHEVCDQMWELDYKESWTPQNWCFWTVVLEKTLESPLDCKEIQPVHPKGNQLWKFIGKTDVEAETPILWPSDAKSWFIWKDPDAGKDWGQEEKGMTEDKMVGWHHWLNGHGFGWTPGVGDGQGGLECCSSWGGKESDTTKQLNWTDSIWPYLNLITYAETLIPNKVTFTCMGVKTSTYHCAGGSWGGETNQPMASNSSQIRICVSPGSDSVDQ